MPEPNCKCHRCEVDFYKKPNRIKKSSRHFCSRDCSNQTQREEIGTHQEFECDECGKKVIRTRNQRRRSKTGLCFCSNVCKNKHVARNLRWGDNPHSHRSRRPKLLEAANNSCQKCGYNEFPELLDIHHNDRDHQNNDWKNLRVVCVRCHLEHHRLGKELDVPVLISGE